MTAPEAVVAIQSRPSRRAARWQAVSGKMWPYLFALPALVVLGLVFVYPLVAVVRDSFYSGTASNLSFSGLSNYHLVLSNPIFIQSLLNNLRLLTTVPVMTVIALFVALVLNEIVRGWKVYRFIVFIPYILPAVAMGLAFSYILQQNGSLNSLLTDLHLRALALDWLGSERISIYSVGGVIVWQQLGFGIILFTAGLLSLPQEVIEASIVDGTSWWQRQWYVVLPQLRRVVELFLVLQSITVLSWVFTYVYVITHGGPGTSSSVMTYYIWQSGFEFSAVGIASTAAVILLGMAGILITIYVRLRVRRGEL
ncbi:MAG: carbohydrate ABC transporter permease [Acidimicrobiales bacterium]